MYIHNATKAEKLIMENQLAILWALSDVPGVGMGRVKVQIRATEVALGIWSRTSPINSHFRGE